MNANNLKQVHKISVLLLGAGKGMRLAGTCKSFIKIRGITLLERAITRFTPYSDEIVVGVSDECFEKAKRIVNNLDICVMAGGPTRLDTLRILVEKAHHQKILIHDVARPFVSEELIERLLDALNIHSSVALCTPFRSNDAVVIGKQNNVEEVVPGNFLFRVQTPIICPREKMIKALEQVDLENPHYCTVVGVLFKSGCTVHLVEGSEENVKITSKKDLIKAERMRCR